jgi:hypothetical protein
LGVEVGEHPEKDQGYDTWHDQNTDGDAAHGAKSKGFRGSAMISSSIRYY